uniref:Biopolymer transport protein ExbD/TolR n=1 Tax=Steinernema glaseri TaxID=37863 RepID=A0A1I7YC75_9BILA
MGLHLNEGGDDLAENHEINVTPFIDVMLADQNLYVGDDQVQRDQLGAVLDAKTKGDKDTTIFFQADKGVDYGDLMEVMNTLRAAGYLKVGLVGLETAAKK